MKRSLKILILSLLVSLLFSSFDCGQFGGSYGVFNWVYDENGKLQNTFGFIDGEDKKIKMVTESEYFFNQENEYYPRKDSKRTYKYDSNNYLIEYQYIVDTYFEKITYNSKGKISSSIYENSSLIYLEENKYDSNNNVIERYIFDSRTWFRSDTLKTKTFYKYDIDNNMISKEIFKYDSNNNLVKSDYLDEYGTTTEDLEEEIIYSDENNSIETFELSNPDCVTNISSDSNGNIIKNCCKCDFLFEDYCLRYEDKNLVEKIIYNQDEEVIQRIKWEYEYWD